MSLSDGVGGGLRGAFPLFDVEFEDGKVACPACNEWITMVATVQVKKAAIINTGLIGKQNLLRADLDHEITKVRSTHECSYSEPSIPK